MQRSFWLERVVFGLLSAAAGCATVPTDDAPSWRHPERSAAAPLLKSRASSGLSAFPAPSDEKGLLSRKSDDRAREESGWSRASLNSDRLLKNDVNSLEPSARRKIVARRPAAASALATERAAGSRRKVDPSPKAASRPENSIRLAQGLVNDADARALRYADDVAETGPADASVPLVDEDDERRLNVNRGDEAGESEDGRALPVPPLPAGDESRGVETGTFPPELPVGYSLSLEQILSVADSQNPNVAFARERIHEAYARVDRASVLWLPSLRTGLNYIHHEGNVQDVLGKMQNTQKSSLYGGLGAMAAGGGNAAIPGVSAQFHLTDALFQPKIAEHQATSRQFGARAVRNDILRNAAVAYLELLRAEQSLAISEEALTNTRRLVKLTGEYARTGQGLRSDHERMLAEQAIRESEVVARVEAVRVSSARLAQLLHADPSVRLSTGEPAVVPLDLVDRDAPDAEFVAAGLMRRPELAEQKHLVQEAVQRLNREKFAPLVPSVLLGFSYGSMGGGLGNQIVRTDDRWDVDAIAFWEIRNLGFGECAARKEMSSLIRQTQHRKVALMDLVAREVVEAHAQLLERERRIGVAKQGIAAAERSYRLNEDRIENAQGLPIESLQAVQALAATRLNYLNSVVDYNIAQFELCRAIGWFDGGPGAASCSPVTPDRGLSRERY